MARARRTISITEKIETKKAEIAKVEEKLAKLQNELKELQTKADAEKKIPAALDWHHSGCFNDSSDGTSDDPAGPDLPGKSVEFPHDYFYCSRGRCGGLYREIHHTSE